MSNSLILAGAGIAVYAASIFGYLQGFERGQLHPPCQEDEVMMVQEDRNPAHGLTWACVNNDMTLAPLQIELGMETQ